MYKNGKLLGDVAVEDPLAPQVRSRSVAGASRAVSSPSTTTKDREVRWYVAGGKVGVPDVREWGRTVAGAVVLMILPPLAARLLARAGAGRAAHAVERLWARSVARWLDLRVEIEGLEHVDPNEAYIVTPLHEGFTDVLALLHLPLPLRFVVRDEFLNWRRLGPYVRDTGQITIRPEQGASSYRVMARAAAEVFAQGESLVIFPQGSILGIEVDCVRGAFALAQALRRPLLPVALTGSHRVWEYPYSPRLRYGQRISMRVLPPVSAGECVARSEDDLRRQVQRDLKAAALSGTMATPRRYVPARDGFWDGYAFRIDPAFPDLAAQITARRSSDRRRQQKGAMDAGARR